MCWCPTLQTLMEDGKRESAVSMLPITPEDSDAGRTYTCRVLNPAAPAGRQTSVTISVQRECFSISVCQWNVTTLYLTVDILVSNMKMFLLTDPPSVTLSVQPQTVTEGAKVLFICAATANPEITGYRYTSPSLILIVNIDCAPLYTEGEDNNVHNHAGQYCKETNM